MFWLGFFIGVLVALIGGLVIAKEMSRRIRAQASRIKQVQRDRRASMRRFRI